MVKAKAEPIVSKSVAAFKTARRVSTPIIAVSTPDPAATMRALGAAMKDSTPVLSWDIARGLRAVNDAAESELSALTSDDGHVNAAEALIRIAKLPATACVFMLNAHLQLQDPAVIQAIWLLRDDFKSDRRTLVLLGPAFQLPVEIAGDITTIDEPLPTRDELSLILDKQYAAAPVPLPPPDDATRRAALDAVVGLSAFTAEQSIAISLQRTGVDVLALWERKREAIENTQGLSVWRGNESLEDLAGIDNVVSFVSHLAQIDAFKAIVFIDEADKAFAGGMAEHTGDGGVAKDQVGKVLTYIEDTGSLGVMFAGCAGCGKTQLVKALSGSSGKPLIIFDIGAMKGGTVGHSEAAIRNALKVVTATAEGRVLFAITANRTTIFTPEMCRRFPDQFYFDIPDDAARAAIWPIHIRKNGLTAARAKFPAGFDAGWTGAEIKRACERAAMFDCGVVEAARFIVPTSTSSAPTIERMRNEANGRFLSASYPGLYKIPSKAASRVRERAGVALGDDE